MAINNPKPLQLFAHTVPTDGYYIAREVYQPMGEAGTDLHEAQAMLTRALTRDPLSWCACHRLDGHNLYQQNGLAYCRGCDRPIPHPHVGA